MGGKPEAPEGPSLEEVLTITREQYKLQGELIDEAKIFFQEQFSAQQAINQPIIDQQLETLIQQSEFAKAQQQRYLDEGVPAQQAAAQALTDLGNTPEGAKFISDMTQAAGAVGGSGGEQRFRQALEGYGVAPQEAAYLSSLGNYEDPAQLKAALESGAAYQDPGQVNQAIDSLSNYDSTARLREAEGIAAADVRQSGEAARTAAMQELESFGIDPSQIARGALDRGLRAQTDAQASLASSQARRGIQQAGVGMDVQAGELAQQSALRELQTRIDSSTQLMQSRVRELQMQGLSAEEARQQADREIGYSQQLSQLEVAQRGEQAQYSGAAADSANRQQALEVAAKTDAYNIYAGNPAGAATAFGTAGGAGGQAAGIANTATNTGMAGYGSLSGMRSAQSQGFQGGFSVANDIYANDLTAYQQQSANAAGPSQLLGSIAGAGLSAYTGGLAGSDRRMKEGISRVGKTDKGLPIYKYKMKGGGQPQMGVMAQDVKKVMPGAVKTMPGGMMAVDYNKMQDGGPVTPGMSPSAGAIPDDVPTALTAGEYVFPEEAVRWIGEEKLGKMIEKARTDRGAQRQGLAAPQQGIPA